MLRTWRGAEKEYYTKACSSKHVPDPFEVLLDDDAIEVVRFVLRLQMSIPYRMCSNAFKTKARSWTERILGLSKVPIPWQQEKGMSDEQILATLLKELGEAIKPACLRVDFDRKQWLSDLEPLHDPGQTHPADRTTQQRKRRRTAAAEPGDHSNMSCTPPGGAFERLPQLRAIANRLAGGIAWDD